MPIVHRCLAALPLLALAARLQAAPVELRVDPARSRIFAVTHGTSLFGAGGPEHAIEATGWTISICLDPERPATPGAAIELDIPVSGLQIDSAEARAVAGSSGTADPSDAANAARLQSWLLGPQGLDAEHHPSIHFTAESVAHPSASYPLVRGKLTLRGVSVPVASTFDMTRADGKLHFTGLLTLNQSDFGIPLQTVNGMTEIADDLNVTFDLWVTATGKPCARSRPQSPQGSAGTGTAGASGGRGGSPG